MYVCVVAGLGGVRKEGAERGCGGLCRNEGRGVQSWRICIGRGLRWRDLDVTVVMTAHATETACKKISLGICTWLGSGSNLHVQDDDINHDDDVNNDLDDVDHDDSQRCNNQSTCQT